MVVVVGLGSVAHDLAALLEGMMAEDEAKIGPCPENVHGEVVYCYHDVTGHLEKAV